ncbi:MAG: hypothetical protein R2709_15180 [Marmoricola sp.]
MQHNAAVVRDVLEGESGAVRDAVLLNAGAALAVYEQSEHAWPDVIRSWHGSGAAAKHTQVPPRPNWTNG